MAKLQQQLALHEYATVILSGTTTVMHSILMEHEMMQDPTLKVSVRACTFTVVSTSIVCLSSDEHNASGAAIAF